MAKFLMGLFFGWPFDSARELFAVLVIVVVLFMAFALISISMALLLEGLLQGVMALTRSERVWRRFTAELVDDSHSQHASGAARLHRFPSRSLKAPAVSWRQKKAS